jgi:hypothetical protein
MSASFVQNEIRTTVEKYVPLLIVHARASFQCLERHVSGVGEGHHVDQELDSTDHHDKSGRQDDSDNEKPRSRVAGLGLNFLELVCPNEKRREKDVSNDEKQYKRAAKRIQFDLRAKPLLPDTRL